MKNAINTLNSNLPFLSELLQADIRLFVKKEDGIFVHNYYHPSQDSLFVNIQKGKKLNPHSDIPVHKAFEMGKPVVGQYGLVINNRPIQEYAYPIIKEDNQEVLAVVAIERDIYLTRSILGEHWDLIAGNLIKAVRDRMFTNQKFPTIAPGEGAIIVQSGVILFANPLAASLLSEIIEHSNQLINRPLEKTFATFPRRDKGKDESQSISKIEEISLKQRTIISKHIDLDVEDNISVLLIRDISELKIRETLLREIHHRVKNNLQTVVSLLQMQGRREKELQGSFGEAINRIKSITLVHEFLSHSSNIEAVDFGQLAGSIIKETIASFGMPDIKLNYKCPEKVFISSEKATNMALVVNELVSNSLEHAGEGLSQINIDLFIEDEDLKMMIADNGAGFSEGFDYKTNAGLGWEIIRALAEEGLGADVSIANGEKAGAKVELTVPL